MESFLNAKSNSGSFPFVGYHVSFISSLIGSNFTIEKPVAKKPQPKKPVAKKPVAKKTDPSIVDLGNIGKAK